MQSGQQLNIQRLERQYLLALSQNGWESPIVLSAAVDFANTLIRDGRTYVKMGNSTQAEMLFNRAKEITTPISITSGIFYTNNFVKARGHAILQIVQLCEQQAQYQKAWINIREVLPFMEKFSYTKRVNISEDDQQVLKLYAQLLFHGCEVCRMQHRKDDMLDQCNKLVDILQRLGITFDSLSKLTKDEFHQEYKKWYTMLARAFYYIGKSQFKVGFERESLRNLYKSWQITELIFGPDAMITNKSKDKYEKLSQKMEFEMIMGSEKVDFQQFKADLQKDVGQDLLRKAEPLKPNKNFNHHILKQVKSYQQIVTQLTSHSSKYQMPEYVKKVREEYEDKLRTISREDSSKKQYQIKNKKIISSRAASTYMNQSLLPQDRLFSPRLSLATQSQRVSQYQLDNHMDQLKIQLQQTQLKQEPLNEMLLSRPQFKSEHVQQKIKIKETKPVESAESIQLMHKKRFKSSKLIPRQLHKQNTNILNNKSETQQSEQKIQKVQTIQDFGAQQQIEEIRIPTTESLNQQQQLQSQQLQSQIQLMQNVKTEITDSSENFFQDLLSRHSVDQLNLAAKIIQQWYREIKQQKTLAISQTIELTPIQLPKFVSQTQCSEKVDSLQTGRNQMKMSVKEMKNSLRKGRNFGFDSIVREIKNTESDQSSSNKAKTLVQIITEFYNLPEQELYFISKLFFDSELKIWKLSNISLRAFSDVGFVNQTEEDEVMQFDGVPLEIKHQLLHIMNLFQDTSSMKGLQLIVYFTLSNDQQKYTLNFKIQNFISYLDEYQRWFSKDRLENFNGLLGIYCKQQNLYQPSECSTIVFSKQEFCISIITKLLYALRCHYYFIRSVVGYKIVSMKDVVTNKLQNEIIDITQYYKNEKIEKERKRIMKMKFLKIEPPKFFDTQQQYEMPTVSSSRNRRQQLFTEEQKIEQSIIIQESENSPSNYSNGENSQQTDNLRQFSNHHQTVDNTSENDYIQEAIPKRSPKKQYSVVNNRNTMFSPRLDGVISSQALIRTTVGRKTQQASHFFEFQKKHQQKDSQSNFEPPSSRHSLEEEQQFRDRTRSEVQMLKEYFPEFHFADLEQFKDYVPKEGPVTQQHQNFRALPYFPPRGIIIEPELEKFQNEFPDSHVLLNVTLKQGNQIITGYLQQEEGKVYMIIDSQNGEIVKKEISIDVGLRLLRKDKILKILELFNEAKEQHRRPTLIEELLQHQYRHTTILLDRYVKRINHYDILIRKEIYQKLQSSQLLPITQLNNIEYSEKSAQLLIEKENETETEESNTAIQLCNEYVNNYMDENALQGKSFRTYRSPFNLQTNKFYYKDKNFYFRVELCFKEVKVFDTKLLYLSDQQAKQDLIILKKTMHELIGQQKLQLKIRQYYPNLHLTYYRTIQQSNEIEKILHIFIRQQMIGFQIRSQSKIQRRLIGKALELRKQQISLEERNRDKFSALDQFLLLYIQDPLQFISNENQRLLKQTILFYYFKQQLKLTLISSSRLRYFMKTYFHRKTFNAQSRVSNIGKVFVECEVYQFNKFYFDQENGDHTYFYFQITPQESRTKIFKLVLDLADICSICPKVTSNNCFNDKILYEILKVLTAYLICYRTNTYHGLKIPLSYITNQSKYDLHNTFTEVTYGTNILEEQQNVRSSQPKLSILINDNVFRKKSQAQIMDIQIENLQFPEEANRILKTTSMLTPVFRGQKFIYKTTKVVNGMYVIITVSYLSINKFQIGLYIPQTCRNFSCYIQQSDFQLMDPVFLEKIFPSCLVTKETIDQFYINRWKFSEISKIYQMAINHPDEFEDFYSEMKSQARAIPQLELQKLTESKVSLNNDDEIVDGTPQLLDSFSDQSRQNLRSSTQPPNFIKKQFSKQFSVQNSLGASNSMRLSLPAQQNNNNVRTDKSLFFRHSPRISNQGSMENFYSSDKDLFFNSLLVRKNNLDMISTFEIKIWEALINKMNITKNAQNRFIFNLDSFKGVLRENLYTQVVYLGNEVNALFEVFVENVRKPLDMFKPCIPIRLNESQNFQLYQRITLFEQPKIVNFKLMLRKVLFSYYNDERRTLQNLRLKDSFADQYEFIQSDIQKSSVYMLNKLKKQLKLNPTKFVKQEVQGDDKCPQVLKVNANYEQYATFKSYQYTLLKRMVFTMSPTQIHISIFYQEKKKIFCLYFESMKNCKNTSVKYTLQEVQKCIPSAISLLNLGLHQELGKRIYQSFKNRLLVTTYQQLL